MGRRGMAVFNQVYERSEWYDMDMTERVSVEMVRLKRKGLRLPTTPGGLIHGVVWGGGAGVLVTEKTERRG